MVCVCLIRSFVCYEKFGVGGKYLFLFYVYCKFFDIFWLLVVWCGIVNGEYDDFVIRGVICGKYDSFFEFYGGRNKRYLCKFGVYLIFFEIGC